MMKIHAQPAPKEDGAAFFLRLHGVSKPTFLASGAGPLSNHNARSCIPMGILAPHCNYLDAYWLPRVRWSQTFVHKRGLADVFGVRVLADHDPELQNAVSMSGPNFVVRA